jgi:hypothetical protein
MKNPPVFSSEQANSSSENKTHMHWCHPAFGIHVISDMPPCTLDSRNTKLVCNRHPHYPRLDAGVFDAINALVFL